MDGSAIHTNTQNQCNMEVLHLDGSATHTNTQNQCIMEGLHLDGSATHTNTLNQCNMEVLHLDGSGIHTELTLVIVRSSNFYPVNRTASPKDKSHIHSYTIPGRKASHKNTYKKLAHSSKHTTQSVADTTNPKRQ